MAGIRLAVPKTAAPGETMEIKALIQHDMESGYRRDSRGRIIARNIITRFECDYNGVSVFAADFGPGIAANPYLHFSLKARNSGTLTFTWTDQTGRSWSEQAQIEVL